MVVYIVISLLDNEDEIEGVFSNEELAEHYIEQCMEDQTYEGCSFAILPETLDKFVH